MLVGAATVFTVSDIARSAAFYRDGLGFAVTFEYGKPTFYVCLCRDDVALHLVTEAVGKRRAGQSAICIFVKDVDAVHAEIVGRGVVVEKPPQDYDYGMRDFDLRDPDGNQIVIGMASKPAP